MLDRAEQIDQRPSQAIDRPGHDDVELAPAGVLEHRVEPRALVSALGAADAGIRVDMDHGPSPPLGDLAELADLVVDGLLVGGDAHVERCAF